MTKTAIFSILCWMLALMLGFFIAERTPILGESNAADLLGQLFGESKTVISHKMYETADLYFHKGVDHKDGDDEDHHDHDHGMMAEREEQEHLNQRSPLDNAHNEHEDEHEHGHHDEAGTANDWLSILGRELKPKGHEHLSDERQEKEILPWIWMSVKSDPQNILAYDTGAFFLAERLDRTEEALKLLADGIEHNPDSVDLHFALGEILFNHENRAEDALVAFETAQELWQAEFDAWADATQDADIPQPPSKRNYRLLNYIGNLREKLGDTEGALEAYTKALGFAPTQHTYQTTLEKIEKLESAGSDRQTPRSGTEK